MTYKAASDLLELINIYFPGKFLMLARTTVTNFLVLKTIENRRPINIKEDQSMGLKESY